MEKCPNCGKDFYPNQFFQYWCQSCLDEKAAIEDQALALVANGVKHYFELSPVDQALVRFYLANQYPD